MRNVSRLLVVAAGLAGIVWMVRVSLDPGEYYSFRGRSDWTHPTSAVAVMALAMAAETGAACWVLRSFHHLWRRGLFALVVFLPLLLVAGGLAHRSAPGFYHIHMLWVLTLAALFIIMSLTSGSLYLIRLLRRRRVAADQESSTDT